MNAIPLSTATPRDTIRRPTRPWRFLRLVRGIHPYYTEAHLMISQDNGLKYLHYVDSTAKFPVRKGLEDLPERIDVSLINEVSTGTCAPFPNFPLPRDTFDVPTSPVMASPLSFSLLTASGTSIADQIAPDQSRWADWTDGLNMLRKAGGHVASSETELFVQSLTEIGLKIKLLGMLDTPAFDHTVLTS